MSHNDPRFLHLPQGKLELGRRTLIMGVVNITPDSFSDGGRFLEKNQAVDHGLRLLEEGADILDLGGESTRPGSQATPPDVEAERVLPVIEQILSHGDAVISIDTNRASVAKAAMEAGASIINDITALRGDPQMALTAAQTGAGLVLMHMKGVPRSMQENPQYDDVAAEVADFLAGQAEYAIESGVEAEKIVLDPGIGFGKNQGHNLLLIRHLAGLCELGYPVLLGASRKAFIGLLTGKPADQRLYGTIGAHVIGACNGADIVRVHDVAPVREALLASDAIMRAGEI